MTAKREPLRGTVLLCGVGAALALVAGVSLGHWRAGLAAALGLLAGSLNGYLARGALRSEIGFGTTSLARLAALTAVGLGLAGLLGLQLAPLVLAGIAAAQLTMAGVAGVQAVRA